MSCQNVEMLHSLKLDTLRNIAYHDRRRRWFLRIGRGFQAASIFLSCGAIAVFFAKLGDFAPAIPSVLAAAATALNLVFDFRGRASEHHSLEKRYHLIMEKLENARNRNILTDALCCDLSEEMNAIHKDEPPLNITLNLISYNVALYQIAGDNREYIAEHRESLRWYESFFADWYDFRSAV